MRSASSAIEVFNQQEDVLVEIHLLLTDLRAHHFPVALRYLYLSPAFSPIQDWYRNPDLNNLVVQ